MEKLSAPDVTIEPIPDVCSLPEHHSRFCPTCSFAVGGQPVQVGLPDMWVLPELCGFLLGAPPPPSIARKSLILNALRGGGACKILQTKGL